MGWGVRPRLPLPPQATRASRKAIAFGKRSHSMKRNPSVPVTKAGWLFKQVRRPLPFCPP